MAAAFRCGSMWIHVDPCCPDLSGSARGFCWESETCGISSSCSREGMSTLSYCFFFAPSRFSGWFLLTPSSSLSQPKAKYVCIMEQLMKQLHTPSSLLPHFFLILCNPLFSSSSLPPFCPRLSEYLSLGTNTSPISPNLSCKNHPFVPPVIVKWFRKWSCNSAHRFGRSEEKNAWCIPLSFD